VPSTVTPGGPPIWIGGESEAVARIAAREADGWNGWAVDVPTFAARVAAIRSDPPGRAFEATWAGPVVVASDAAEADRIEAGRRERGSAPATFAGDVEAALGWLGELAAAGATWAILLAAGGPERADLIGRELLPRLAVHA
jgi:alkanesulfonate monooxygenase SsuD/methylene tetrahydromethanopterin reductase-like flavin-dependent oxidoreductase (luciferase family)